MKKQLLLLSMIGLLTLAGCGDVNQQKGDNGEQIIVKIGDQNYTANDLFENYSSTSTGASQYYNAVYDVLVNVVQPITENIKSNVNTKMDQFLKSVEDAATENGTSKATEQSKKLESEGVEDLAELEEVYTLAEKKTAYEDKFYENNKNSTLLAEYINYYAPYHIRHILAKTNSGDSLYDGTIDKDAATKVANIVIALANDKQSFNTIASSYSDDYSVEDDVTAGPRYDSVGIMTTTTSFVNEFKYAIYQYDSLYNTAATANVTAYNERQATRKIGNTDYEGSSLIPSDVDTNYLKSKLHRIDYSVFTDLKEYASITTDSLKTEYKEDKYLPRNILFNDELNNHALGVITRGKTGKGNRFWHIDGLSASNDSKDDVLCDEAKRPILVTRAGSGSGDSGYQGIHFIIIQKSPFVKTGSSELLAELESYYDIKARENNVADSYVNFIDSTSESIYDKRSKVIETDVKGFDSYMSYRIYEQALKEAKEKGTIKFGKVNDKSIDSIIESYLNANRTSAAYSAKETYEESWTSYIRLLKAQDQQSALKVSSSENYLGIKGYLKVGGR